MIALQALTEGFQWNSRWASIHAFSLPMPGSESEPWLCNEQATIKNWMHEF